MALRPPYQGLPGGHAQSAKKRTRGKRLSMPARGSIFPPVNARAEPALSIGRLNRIERACALLTCVRNAKKCQRRVDRLNCGAYRIELLARSRVDPSTVSVRSDEMNTMLKTSLAAAASAALLGARATAGAAEYANVVSATPVTDSVAVPRQECVQSEQLVQQPPSGAGALIGAIAGGVIGNQFGHGFGRAAATGVGAVAGSAIGNNVEANANPPTTVPVQRCRTVNGYESRVVGYDVVYEYHGQRYTTRLPSDPGARLAIDVRPTANAPLDRVGPPASSRRRSAGVCAGRAELQRSAAGLLRRAAPAYYAPGAGRTTPAPATTRAVLRRAGGDRPRHRLLDRQHVAPRLPQRLARPSRLALSRSPRRMKKGPAGPFLLRGRARRGVRRPPWRRRGPSRAPCSSSPTRCRTRRRP